MKTVNKAIYKLAFTLTELLVVVVVITILTAVILLPAFSKTHQNAPSLNCVSNLKQVGMAMMMYASDYTGHLPGPCEAGTTCTYFYQALPYKKHNSELPYYLSTYLGGKPPTQMTASETQYIRELFCPGYGSFSEQYPNVAMTQVTYLLSFPHTNSVAHLSIRPFGAARNSVGPLSNPITLFDISKYGAPADVFAISDVDTNLPLTGGLTLEAQNPNHGTARNVLYFDGHVKSCNGTNFLSQ